MKLSNCASNSSLFGAFFSFLEPLLLPTPRPLGLPRLLRPPLVLPRKPLTPIEKINYNSSIKKND